MRRLIVFGAVLALALVPILGSPVPALAQVHAMHHQSTTHVVRAGETLTSIAQYYGVTPESIAQANNLVNPNMIYAGQVLVIPGSGMPAPGPGPMPGVCQYTVCPGDTLSSIAARYGTTVNAIMVANGLTNPNFIYIGQVLSIPGCGTPPPMPPQPPVPPHPGPGPCGTYYTVQSGDTLSGIAAMYHTTWQTIAQANGLHYPYVIYPGQQLYIPCGHHPTPPPDGHGPKPTPKPQLKPAACAREVQIVRPLEGQHMTGVVQIVGTASIKDFQFYKLEYAFGHLPLDNSAFMSINEVHTTPVVDTVLGTWFVGNMPTGPYTLKLTAVDNRGQFPAPCSVHIFVDK